MHTAINSELVEQSMYFRHKGSEILHFHKRLG